ncbi:cyclic AMP-dependent transcription factor ATF-3-like [Actinia tenebrosa]|uniref:Cyclic AMP-dependent transcription factor ATF-3-like n=1 Tax=Actinia tenebrosa TaxID=6105 RepID=A0A6P8H451_ACTTE|nr:cyclic AMP-dependent transcription factor ATF-3-like [Actinia tenebrosa]
MEAGEVPPVLNLNQNPEVNMTSFAGVGTSSLCMDTTSEEFVIDVKNESPYFTLDENSADMEYIYKTPLDGSNPHLSETVSHEELERKLLRRERNKVAASKCRQKRKEHVRNLVQASDQLEAQNSTLQSQISKLHDEIKQLEFMLDSHSCSRHMAGNHGNSCSDKSQVPDAS